MKKKILAGLLALCMIFSMVPMSAFAAEGDTTNTPEMKVGIAQTVEDAKTAIKAAADLKNDPTVDVASGSANIVWITMTGMTNGTYTLSMKNKDNQEILGQYPIAYGNDTKEFTTNSPKWLIYFSLDEASEGGTGKQINKTNLTEGKCTLSVTKKDETDPILTKEFTLSKTTSGEKDTWTMEQTAPESETEPKVLDPIKGTWNKETNTFTAETGTIALSLEKSGNDGVTGNNNDTYGYYAAIKMPVLTEGQFYILSRGTNTTETALNKAMAETKKESVTYPIDVDKASGLAAWQQVYNKSTWDSVNPTYWPEISRQPVVNVTMATPKGEGDTQTYDYKTYKFDFSKVELELPFTVEAATDTQLEGFGEAKDFQKDFASTTAKVSADLTKRDIVVTGTSIKTNCEAFGTDTTNANYVAMQFKPKADVGSIYQIKVAMSDGKNEKILPKSDLSLLWQFNKGVGDNTGKATNTKISIRVYFGDNATSGSVAYTVDCSNMELVDAIVPKIEDAGFEWDAATANTKISKAINDARGDGSAVSITDSDDQTFWMILSDFEAGDYTYTVKENKAEATALCTGEFSIAEQDLTDKKGKPAFYFSPLDGGNLTWSSFPTNTEAATTYVISVVKKGATGEAATPITKEITVPAYTAPTVESAELRNEDKTLTVTLDKALRGEYKVELLKADGETAAADARNEFLNGETIAFTGANAFEKGGYKIRVSTRNTTPITMVEATFTVSGPVPTIVPAPIVDHPATGETEKTNLGTVTVGTVTADATEANTYSFTLTGENIVPHKNANGDEGPWVGFGMPIEEGSTYSYSYKKGAEDTNHPLASVKDRVYEDEDGNKYNTIYFDEAGDYTVTQTATKDSADTVVTYKVKVVINVAPITLTAATATGTVLEKAVTDLQDITVAAADANKKIAITGTSKYVADYTGFSSNAIESQGNYIALTLEAKQNSNAVKSVWVKNSKNAWVKVDDTDHTHVIRLNDYTGTTIDVAISATQPAANKTADYTLDISGLTLAPAPATGLSLNVASSTGILADLGSKYVTDLQEKVVVATGTDLADFAVSGEANYVLGWNEFSSNAEEQYGHYVALTFSSAPGNTIAVEGGPTLTEDGILVKRLENFTGDDKQLTIVVTKPAEGAAPAQTEEYTIDYSGVTMKPAVITVTQATDDDNITATYKDGKVALVGIVEFGEGKTEKEVNVTVTVNGTEKTVKAVIKQDATDKTKLSVADAKIAGTDISLAFDITDLHAKKADAAQAATVVPPTAEVSDTITNAADKQVAKEISDALTAENAKTEVEEEVLKKYADVAANDAAAKDTLLANAAKEVADNANAVPNAVKTAIENAVKPEATDTEKAAVTTVVQVYTKIEVKAVTTTGEDAAKQLTSFTVSITPTAQTIVTTLSKEDVEKSPEDVKVVDTEKSAADNQTAGANAILVKEEPVKIDEATEVVLALPTSFPATDNAYIEHVKERVGTFIYTGTITTTEGAKTLNFTSLHGFSDFTVYADDPSVAKIGDVGYTSLADAIKAAEDGAEITLTTNCSGDKAIASNITLNEKKTLTFKGQAVDLMINGTKYTVAAAGTKVVLPKTTNDRPIITGPTGPSITTYPITAPTATGGKVSVSSTAAAGATVTITTTPDEGKKVDTVTVTDASGKAVAVTKADTNKYTFVMPSSAVSVSVTFIDGSDEPTPPDEWENPYSDVTKNWAYEAIKFVTEKKLMQDTGKGKFEPNTKLTRGMFARILYNHAGSPAVTGTVNFKDFETGKWYSNAVVWANQKDVLKGLGDGRVGVNDPITREQLVVLLWRYVGSPKTTENVTVNGNPSSWAVEAMRWAVSSGVIEGDQNGNHNPKNTATRAEVAKILYNYFGQEK